MKGLTITKVIVAVLGSIFVIIGALTVTLFSHFVNKEVAKRSYIGFNDNGSFNEFTQKWIIPPYNMALQVWTYSVTNLDEVLKNGSYPELVEKGPYSFSLYQKKSKHVFMRNGTQVLYRTNRVYYFNSSLSCGTCSLSDKVIIPNPIFQFIVDVAATGSLVRAAIEGVLMFFPSETPFITTTVGEMLFDGFEDPIIELACGIKIVQPVCEALKVPKRVGFFYGQNGTADGEYLIDTGLSNVKNLGRVYEYNGMSKLPDRYWYSAEARMINGTNEIFPPDLSKSEPLFMFLGQLKRSIYLKYKEKIDIEGVPAWRYVMPPELYDPVRPENRGFCNPSSSRFFDNHTQPDGCLPNGFLDMSSTQFGNPRIYLSGSHFYYSPSSVYQVFKNFKEPSAENDEPQFDVEPVSFGGIALLTIGSVLLVIFAILLIITECITRHTEDRERLISSGEHGYESIGSFPYPEPLPNFVPSPGERSLLVEETQPVIEPLSNS